MKKAEIRQACRKRWGKNWHKAHPVIKKARMVWAAGGDPNGEHIVVYDKGGDTYVA